MDKLDLIKVKNFLLQKSSLWIWKVKPLTGRKWSVGGSVMLIPHDPMDCCLPDSSVHGILQVRILEWVAIPFSRGSSQPRDRTWVSCTAGRFFTIWATGKPMPWSSDMMLNQTRSLPSKVTMRAELKNKQKQFLRKNQEIKNYLVVRNCIP